MPVDPDCDTGDCGDEPPDPEPGCNTRDDCSTDIYRNDYSEGDPVADAVSILEDGSLVPQLVWIKSQYPEPMTQATWLPEFSTHVGSDYIRLAEYNEQYPYPYLSFVGTIKGNGGSVNVAPTVDIGPGNTLNGRVSLAPEIYGGSVIEVYMYNGSSAPGVDTGQVPYMMIQHSISRIDGVCTYQARKFGPYANVTAYATALESFPAVPPSGTFAGFAGGALPPISANGGQEEGEADIAIAEVYPWDYSHAIALPIQGLYDIDLPSGWFSNGVTGVNIKLSSIPIGSAAYGGVWGPFKAPQCNVDYSIYNWTLSGQPSWMPSSFTSPGCGSIVINTARTVVFNTPNGAGYSGNLRTTTNASSLSEVNMCGGSVVGALEKSGFLYVGQNDNAFDYAGTETKTYSDAPPSVFNYTTGDLIFNPFSQAVFTPDIAVSPRTSHAVSVLNGTWAIYLEPNTTYTYTYDANDPDTIFYPTKGSPDPSIIRSGTVTIKSPAPSVDDCTCFVYGANAFGYEVPTAPGNTIPPEVIALWLAADLDIVAGSCGTHGVNLPCFCDGGCFYKRNEAHTGYSLYQPDGYLKGCRKTEEQVIAGLSTGPAELMDTPCSQEECEAHTATWMAEAYGEPNKEGLYKVKWILLDDCPGACCSDQPTQPEFVKSSTLVDVPCKCGCD
jgi:hypothetical protein